MIGDTQELDAAPTTVPIENVPLFPTSETEQPIDIDIPDFPEVTNQFDIKASQEGTRAKIAMRFTTWFLLLVALVLIGPFLANIYNPQAFPNPLSSSKELVTVLSSILAGPFGFIVGFYFKQSTDK